MRRYLPVLILIALPALADGYKFHVNVTDGRTGLLANPDFEKLKLTEEQLDRAAKERVMVFDHTTGTHWIWLMMSWPEDRPTVELGINDRGGGAPGKNADIGLTPLDGGMIRLRCYREQCAIRVGLRPTVTLQNEESRDFPLDSDFDITFDRR